MEFLRQKFTLLSGAEVAIEIDPRTLTSEMMHQLGASGVTRASLGVQSFDPDVQQAINRVQSFEATAAATEGLRAAGVRGINFDLIYGLPHQTVASCFDTVRKCLQLRPDRFSVFGYAHVPTFKKHQRKIDESVLPDGASRHLQSNMIADSLTAAGYRQIGLDHFALPEDSLATAQAAGTLHRNFQGYTTDTSDVLIGFGASAIGQLEQGYIQNDAGTRSYCEQISRRDLATRKGYALTTDDRLRADIIERIMCDFRVDLREACARHATTPDVVLRSATRLPELIADGIIHLEGRCFRSRMTRTIWCGAWPRPSNAYSEGQVRSLAVRSSINANNHDAPASQTTPRCSRNSPATQPDNLPRDSMRSRYGTAMSEMPTP